LNSIIDGHHADDVLSEILRNVPHKPMKSLGYENGHVVNQFPIPDDPPPFKPLSSYSAPSVPFDSFGPPTLSSLNSFNKYSSGDHFSDFSNKNSVSVADPSSYNAYHKMTLLGTKSNHAINDQPNFVTLPTEVLGKFPKNGLEIQKSIAYEIKL
jgi:hypothetical protein